MASPTRNSHLGSPLGTLLTSHQFLGSLVTMAVVFFTLLTSFQAVIGLIDWLGVPSDPDRRNSLEFWTFGVIAAGVIFIAGFILRSCWWPALTGAPLLILSQTTRGPYGSSLEEAFIGWMPRFFLAAAIITVLSGSAGTLLARWANSRETSRTSADLWRPRLIAGLAVFTAITVFLAGATRAIEDDEASDQQAHGQWIYGVASNEDMLLLGTGNGIVALDPDTQAERWHFYPGEPVMHAPTIADDRIYFGSHTTYAYAVDLNGTELWRYDMDNWVFNSPVVANNLVYVGSSAKFVALDAATGTEIWTIDLGTWVEVSWSEVADGMIYLGTAHGELLAVDATTGKEQWRFVVPQGAEAPEATPGAYTPSPWIKEAPVVANGVVFFGCGDHKVYAVDAETGEALWHFDTARPGQPNVAVAGGLVYAVTHDNVYALHAREGSVIWHMTVDGGIWYAPVVADDLLIVTYDRVRGQLTGLDLATGEQRWMYVFSEDPDRFYEFTYLHLRDDVLYAGSSGEGLFAFDAATGALLWQKLDP